MCVVGGRNRETRTGRDPSNDKGNQTIWEHFKTVKVLFPPGALWSEGSVRGWRGVKSMTSDLVLVKCETPVSPILIHMPHSLLMSLSAGHDWFPITAIGSESTNQHVTGMRLAKTIY